MKSLKMTFAAAVLACSFGAPAVLACPGHDKAPAADKSKKETPKHVATASFRVDGMHCEGCADHVKTALANTAGVVKVDVKVSDKRVTVDYDSDKLSPDKIAKIISDLGYPAAAEA